MLIFLPNPVAAQVESREGYSVRFAFHDPEQAASFAALIDQARTGGFAVLVSLLHYEGAPDGQTRRHARARRRAVEEQP